MKTKRLMVPRVTTALQLLEPKQRKAIKSDRTNAKQRFKNVIVRLSHGKPIQKKHLSEIARIAAKLALPRAKKAVKIKKISLLIGAPVLIPPFFFEKSGSKTITFANGTRARLEITAGSPINNAELFGKGIRAKIVPLKISEEERKKLMVWREGPDYSTSLAGSIGYFGLTLNTQTGSKSTLAIVHNIQQRMLPELSKGVQNKYSNWRAELLRVLEDHCQRIGIDKLLVINGKEYFKGARNLEIEYQAFEKILIREGYVLQSIQTNYPKRLFGEPKTYQRSYWVKKIH